MANRAHCMVVARDPSTGATLLAATINVYAPGTVTPIVATMFDKNGNTLSNPLTSDATTGLVDFYLNVAQEVDLVVAKAGYTTRTYSNVPVLDDAGYELTSLLTTTGDMPYASSANTPARLPVGGTGTFLTVSGGVPTWSNTIASGGLTITAGGETITAGGLVVTAGNVGIGTAALTNTGLIILETINGSSGQAVGINSSPTLVAGANNDTLYGMVNTPTFNDNSKSGVTHIGMLTPSVALNAATPTAAAATIALGQTTTTSATAGGNGAVPAQVAGYWSINIGGTVQKVPYFNA